MATPKRKAKINALYATLSDGEDDVSSDNEVTEVSAQHSDSNRDNSFFVSKAVYSTFISAAIIFFQNIRFRGVRLQDITTIVTLVVTGVIWRKSSSIDDVFSKNDLQNVKLSQVTNEQGRLLSRSQAYSTSEDSPVEEDNISSLNATTREKTKMNNYAALVTIGSALTAALASIFYVKVIAIFAPLLQLVSGVIWMQSDKKRLSKSEGHEAAMQELSSTSIVNKYAGTFSIITSLLWLSVMLTSGIISIVLSGASVIFNLFLWNKALKYEKICLNDDQSRESVVIRRSLKESVEARPVNVSTLMSDLNSESTEDRFNFISSSPDPRRGYKDNSGESTDTELDDSEGELLTGGKSNIEHRDLTIPRGLSPSTRGPCSSVQPLTTRKLTLPAFNLNRIREESTRKTNSLPSSPSAMRKGTFEIPHKFSSTVLHSSSSLSVIGANRPRRPSRLAPRT